MKIHRFYIGKALANEEVIILENPELAHQMKDVLRMESGDSVILFDDEATEYLAEVISMAKTAVHIKVVERKNKAKKNQKNLCICSSVIKKDNYEWVLEKCTEIGVSSFIPIITSRTEKKDLNLERAKKIVTEAAEQSGRVTIPTVNDVKRLENVLVEVISNGFMPLVLHMDGKPFSKDEIWKIAGKGSEKYAGGVAVFVGPEGGWSLEELGFFKSHDVAMYSIGENVLRAETASVAISALMLL